MQPTKKQVEFSIVLLMMCIVIAALIMFIDFGIKAAILEESNRLRLKIEEWERGQSAAAANESGASDDAPVDASIPGDVLVVNPARMEEGHVSNGTAEANKASPNNRSKPSRPTSARRIPQGDK